MWDVPLHAPGTEPRHTSVCYVFSCTPPAPQPCFLMFLCSKKLICNGNTSCILWGLTDRRHQKEMNVQRVRQTCSFFPNPLPARSVIRTVSFLPPQVTASSHTLPDSGSSHLFLCPGGNDWDTAAINSHRKLNYPFSFLWDLTPTNRKSVSSHFMMLSSNHPP